MLDLLVYVYRRLVRKQSPCAFVHEKMKERRMTHCSACGLRVIPIRADEYAVGIYGAGFVESDSCE